MNDSAIPLTRERIRVRGIVQGVGFRPTVWRLAREHGIRGDVCNDAHGVLIRAWGKDDALNAFADALVHEAPPLAWIEAIERHPLPPMGSPPGFAIAHSEGGAAHTGVSPDAAVCRECIDDTLNPSSRRHRYPFTNCTHCGPRFSIIAGIPYDRPKTSMAAFTMCSECLTEYESPADRRFHAQPNACHACGPRAWLERLDGHAVGTQDLTQSDDVDAVCTLLQRGEIVAVKGIGGFHLACDATSETAVRTLRERKRRYHKPFALMAKNLDIVRRYCDLGPESARLLASPAAPIVILERGGTEVVAEAVAPGQRTLGFMLPYSPLHHLILRRMERPIVLTSGNLSDAPPCIDNADARRRLRGIADYGLFHDRDIVNRVDDSVVRVMGAEARILRRARGYAPRPIKLPAGFATAPPLLAMGAELKNTFCLLKDGQAILSQHIGNLEEAGTYADYRRNLELYGVLYEHDPEIIVVDRHPEYLSTKLGRKLARARARPLTSVQHHHAHVAACLAENGVPLVCEPVLGVALDGLGMGEDQTFWGGEFLLADYRRYERLGTFKPVAMLGGTQAIREPWRNTYAHLAAGMGWARYRMDYVGLDLTRYLESRPLATLDAMLATGTNSPLASSCGRLFDAVAAAVGIRRERVSYEGQAAVELEALIDDVTMREVSDRQAYPFAIRRPGDRGLPFVEPIGMWRALLGDLVRRTPLPLISARFHAGLARAIVAMIEQVSTRGGERLIGAVALTGGVFQNRRLLEQVSEQLEAKGLAVLTHRLVPANDGGIALGQAVIAAAQASRATHPGHSAAP